MCACGFPALVFYHDYHPPEGFDSAEIASSEATIFVNVDPQAFLGAPTTARGEETAVLKFPGLDEGQIAQVVVLSQQVCTSLGCVFLHAHTDKKSLFHDRVSHGV